MRAETEYQHLPASEVCDGDVMQAFLRWQTDRNSPSFCCHLEQDETVLLLHGTSWRRQTYQSVTQNKVETIPLRIYHLQNSGEVYTAWDSAADHFFSFLLIEPVSSIMLPKTSTEVKKPQLFWIYKQINLKQFIASITTFWSWISICDWK